MEQDIMMKYRKKPLPVVSILTSLTYSQIHRRICVLILTTAVVKLILLSICPTLQSYMKTSHHQRELIHPQSMSVLMICLGDICEIYNIVYDIQCAIISMVCISTSHSNRPGKCISI